MIAALANDEMSARLQWIKLEPRYVLDVGCGTGDGSRKLAALFPEARIISLDNARAMLASAEEINRQHCLEADGGRLPFKDKSFDVLFANLFLPWQQPQYFNFKEWLRVLQPDGVLILSTLGPDTLKELKESFNLEMSPPYFVDMHDLADKLLQAGFIDPIADVDHYTLAYQDVNKLLAELKATGMCAQTHALPSSISATSWEITYEVIYVHAFVKNFDEPEESQSQSFSVAKLRSLLPSRS